MPRARTIGRRLLLLSVFAVLGAPLTILADHDQEVTTRRLDGTPGEDAPAFDPRDFVTPAAWSTSTWVCLVVAFASAVAGIGCLTAVPRDDRGIGDEARDWPAAGRRPHRTWQWLHTEILPTTLEFDRFIAVVGLALAILLNILSWYGVLRTGIGWPWAISMTFLAVGMGVHVWRAFRRVKVPSPERVDHT